MEKYQAKKVLSVNGIYYKDNDIVSLDMVNYNDDNGERETINIVGRLIIGGNDSFIKVDCSSKMRYDDKEVSLSRIESIKTKDGSTTIRATKPKKKTVIYYKDEPLCFEGQTVEVIYGSFFNRKRVYGKLLYIDEYCITIDASSEYKGHKQSILISKITNIKRID